jgi:hypothetical protein
MRTLVFLIIAALAVVAYAASEHSIPNDGLPLVRADYPMCVTVQPPPIRAPKHDVFHPQANAELS